MKKIAIRDRDIKIFRFLWRHKLSTTAYLRMMFFPNAKGITAYQRLNFLKNSGYLKLYICDRNKNKMWGITKKSYQYVKKEYPDLDQDGFRSETPYHDMLVNIVHKGVFDAIKPSNIGLLTEQELRRLPREYIPSGIPKDGRRADGYWIINAEKNKKRIALEVELSPKRANEYANIAHFYEFADGINFVIWVTQSSSLAQRIATTLMKTTGKRNFKHSFVLLDDFLKNSAIAPVMLGANEGASIADIFGSCGASKILTPIKPNMTNALSEMRIKYWKQAKNKG